MKSKTFLILATIAIIAVSSIGIAGYVLVLPTHEQLEIIDIEPISANENNVYLKWYGNEMDIECTMVGTYAWALGNKVEWTEHASYGYVFNVSVPLHYYDIWFCFEDKELHLYATHSLATLRHRGGEPYFIYWEEEPEQY
jgi:hypothetical protein